MKETKEEDFNGYDFDEKETRRKMKYIAIYDGRLDLNGAYGFQNKRELKRWLESTHRRVIAVFKIEDIANKI